MLETKTEHLDATQVMRWHLVIRTESKLVRLWRCFLITVASQLKMFTSTDQFFKSCIQTMPFQSKQSGLKICVNARQVFKLSWRLVSVDRLNLQCLTYLVGTHFSFTWNDFWSTMLLMLMTNNTQWMSPLKAMSSRNWRLHIRCDFEAPETKQWKEQNCLSHETSGMYDVFLLWLILMYL